MENAFTDQLDRARQAASLAYAPYSNFRVGAVVIATDGSEFASCNVENAAYGSSICAEANALSSAVATGHVDIATVVVVGLDSDGPCYPCGNCRQLMGEFGVTTVVVEDGQGGVVEHRFDEFLPHSFGPEDLA